MRTRSSCGASPTALDEFLANGRCEFIKEYAQPFAMFAVADVLGVPEEDHGRFRQFFGMSQPPGMVNQSDVRDDEPLNKLDSLDEWFSAYIEDRRANPREDVLTRIAQATFSDGSTPTVTDVMLLASNLFAAGQETTVRLLAYSLQKLGEDPELQQRLREDRSAIPNFVEEALRFESPIKGEFRLAKRTVEVGGVTIPAGSTVMVINGAANRDERKFECPAEFRVDREDAREHIAFGHGIHFCIGAALARAEGRITVECMLDRLDDIRISEEHHGPPDARKYRYAPTYMLRGLSELHLEFTPNGG